MQQGTASKRRFCHALARTMDMLAKAPPCRVQKDQLHGILNRRVLTKQRPHWDDTTRGMFIALLRQSTRTLPSRNFPVECTIDGLRLVDTAVFKAIAELMKGKEGFADFNEHLALEKWAWLCTMYAKAKIVNKHNEAIVWRYLNSMDFLGEDTVTTQPFVDLLTTETFTALCAVYDANDNDRAVIMAFNLIAETYTRRKSTRRSLDSVVSAIKNEMEPPTKVQILETPVVEVAVPSTQRMTTRAQARTSMAGPLAGVGEIKLEIKQEEEEKFERTELEEEEIDFTGSSASGLIWTNDMIDELVEEVNKRQSYWDPSHAEYRSITKRRDAMSSIAQAINTKRGTTLTEKDIADKWNHMRTAFGKMVNHCSASAASPAGHFYEQMSFLLMNNHNGPARTDLSTPSPASSEGGRHSTPTVTITEGAPLNLHDILKGVTHETPTKQTLKQMLDAGLTLQPLAAPTSSAAASSSNGHITAYMNGNGNTNGNGTTKNNCAAKNAIDSWTAFGRLVEISGRELNRASASMAIRMQRALHQVLHDYRAEAASAGMQF